MAGESVAEIRNDIFTPTHEIEAILREGATGKFDPLPMKQARAYGQAAGVKVGRMVGV